MKRTSIVFLVACLAISVLNAFAVPGDFSGGTIVTNPGIDRIRLVTLDEVDTCTIDYQSVVNGGGNPGVIHWPDGTYGGPMGIMNFTSTCDPNPLYAYCIDLAHGLDPHPYCVVIYDTPINPNCPLQVPAMAYIMSWFTDNSAFGDDVLQLALWKFMNDPTGTPYYCPPGRANEDSVYHTNASRNNAANTWVTLASGESDGMPKNVILCDDTLKITTPGPTINGSVSDLVIDINLTRGPGAIALGNTSVSGVKIVLTTSHGTLSDDTVYTDQFGHAQVLASNPISEGLVPVTVTACTRGYWPRSIVPCDPNHNSQGLVQALSGFTPCVVCVELSDRFLAAELASFDVIPSSGAIDLRWHTASETNVERWEVERRMNGNGYETVTALPAEGSATGHSYNYTDRAVEAGITYEYRLVDVDLSGTRTTHDEMIRTASVSETEEELPSTFYLADAYPNPFNPETRIRFSLPEGGTAILKVYDAVGREVATLANGYYTAGTHAVAFRGDNLPSGLYFYKLTAGGSSMTKKMVLMK